MALSISDTEIALFSEYIHAVSGIQIDPSKKYFIETRLDDLIQVHGSYTKLREAARNDRTGSIQQKIISAISTNETFFFRDIKTFDLLRFKCIPEHFLDPSIKAISIWSAASSTGQEAYSISMILKELLLDLTAYRCKIYGTDISPEAVNRANKAEYSKFELDRGLTPKQIETYFTHSDQRFKIINELRSICRFQVDNLLQPQTVNESFDIIFCRNVLIYFSLEDRLKVYSNIQKRLKKNGILLIGATESLLHETSIFKRSEFRGSTYYTVN
jgi:chemotaxis protein methyltransferase CheR